MITICVNLKRLLKWMGENRKNTQEMLALSVFGYWRILVQKERKNQLIVQVVS